MKNDSGQTTSVWRATAEVPEFSPLAEDTQADVCIVGAGIAGLTTAYLLAREGKSVAVFDDGRIGGGMTERTTAHLSNAFDDRYQEMENLYGEHGSRLIADSHTAAIDRIEQIVIEEKIECEFERLDGYLFAALNQSKEILEGELKSAHRAGLEGVEQVGRAPIADFDTGMCLRFPRQAQFHPLKYLAGLARAIERDGGRIFTATHITEMEGGAKTYVKTSDGHTVTAEAIVIATNAPINNIVTIHTKQAPYTTYAIGARVPRGSVTRALYWDTLDPYHYVRLESSELDNYDLLIVGGEDHKSGQVDDYQERHARLEAWARERWPMIEAVEFQWSGQVMEPVDGVAFIGRNPGDPRNVYIATGDSGMGMTHGMIAGILITDLIAGRTCSWVPLYDPSRVTLRAAGDFARENFNVVAQYATGLAGPGDVGSAEEVAPGTGAVIRRGLSKVAVYCDESGVRHELSAVCKHLGCIVDWNPVESSWDCPCHGSRFNKNGHVITALVSTQVDL
jgi:glycine/D-amino acid oxidase-like deaminating enzyme/nitrite reductase/ring-hydroxylating ferredoxin subunit